MADNETSGSGKAVATDKVTYSDDADQNVQIVRIVQVTGAEGSKTVVDLPGDATNGLDVDVTRLPALPAGTNNIGDVDILSIAAGDNNIGNVDVVTLPAIPAGTNNIGDVDVLTVPAPLSTTGGGTEATALRVTIANDSTGVVSVDDNGGSLTVDNGGTFAVQVDGSALTALQLIDDTVFADDAAFTTGTSKVSAVGVLGVAHGSDPAAVAAGDAAVLIANRHRILYTLGGHPNLQSAEYITTASQTDDAIMPAISTGTKYVIAGVTVTCNNANTVNVSVRIGFGTTTVPAQGASGADAVAKVILSHPGIAPGSGVLKGHAGGIIGIGGDGEELRITCGAPTSGSLVVQVDYFTIAS